MKISLSEVLDFGNMPIANAFLSPAEFPQEFFYRMVLGYDPSNAAIGLIHTVPREKMFHDQYAFFSSTSRYMIKHFSETASHLRSFVRGGIVVEIGSNDGVMLEAWEALGVTAVGVEPSGNVANVSRSKGHRVISEFLSPAVVTEITDIGNVDVVFAANVSCHVENIEEYAELIASMIGTNGVFVFEDPYFIDIYEKTSYDQIYDEHIWYFTVAFINNLFRPLGYHVFHAEHISVHGGELRMYVGHQSTHPVQQTVDPWVQKEQHLDQKLREFVENVERSKSELVRMLTALKSENKKMCGFGASSKGVIVANYCGIGPDLIPFITDNTPIKQGKYYPGVHIPIVPQERFGDVDVAVLFAWNHLEEINATQQAFRDRGGKWLTHVPQPRML